MSTASHVTQPTDASPQEAIFQMITGYWVSQAVVAAAELGIADRVADEPKSCAELARVTGTQPDALYRLLRALAGAGVLRQVEDGRFGATPLSACLQTNAPESMRAYAQLQTYQYGPWGELLQSLRTGETAFDTLFGQPLFPFLEQNPEASAVFDASMRDLTSRVADAVLAAYDFSPFGTLVDVGGGSGQMIEAILHAHPTLRGVLFDQPHVVENARQQDVAQGFGERLDFVAGDFFREVPTGGDAYLLKMIVHDWNDEEAVTLLHACHRAMAPGARLLVIEGIVPPVNEDSLNNWIDLTMMMITGGRERTEPEYRELFQQAGFAITRIVPTSTEMSIIEAIRA